MKLRLIHLFSFLLLLCAAHMTASPARQVLKYTEYTVENGLSYNSVIDICQDTSGAMWFATTDGLNRFNGHDITIYRHTHNDSTSLPSNSLHKVKMDSDNVLWICTSNGLACYDAVADVFRKADIPGAVSIEDMVQVDSNRFLLATRNASYLYDKRDGTSSEFRIDDAPLIFYSACRDGDNIIICTRWRYVETLHISEGRLVRKYPPLRIPRFGVAPISAGNDTYYIGTKGAGLLKANVREQTWKRIDNGDKNWFQIFSLAYDREGKLWVGTENGLMVLQDDECIYTSEFQELKDKNIRSLWRDRSGGMWIGTEFAGVKYWNRQRDKFSQYTIPGRIQAVEDEIVTSIFCDYTGAIWIGTRYGGLDRYFPETGMHFHYDVDNVRTICISEDGKYAYTGAEVNGMHSINLTTGAVRLLSTPIDIMSIKRAEGGKLWLGSLVGLHLYDPEKDLTTRIIPETGNRLIRFLNLFKDSAGRLWSGAKENLMVFRTNPDNSVQDVTPDILKDIVQIQCFYETKDKTIWIGTIDGLIAYRESGHGKGFIEYISGLQSTTVRGIEEDSRGYLWISTDNGLCRYERSTGKIRWYNEDDGLRCSLFNACAHATDIHGKMYFGGINGVEVFTPEEISVNRDSFRPEISELIVNNISIKPDDNSGILDKSIQLTEKITLRHWQNSVTIRFSCADMVSGNSTLFKYKLDGFDKDWNMARGREATYTNLNKGKYVFLLLSANNDGIWCDSPRRLEIRVRPIWYKSTAATIIFMLLTLGGITAAVIKILRKAKASNDKEIQQLTRKYEEKVQKTRLEMIVDSSYDLKPQEEEFLSSALAFMEKNLTDSSFSVESLAEHMCISRGNLHLKIKNLTGKSPVELIKEMRLKKACTLLKESRMTIAEVAEASGFQTSGYFITVFRSHFGETPGKYAARIRQK